MGGHNGEPSVLFLRQQSCKLGSVHRSFVTGATAVTKTTHMAQDPYGVAGPGLRGAIRGLVGGAGAGVQVGVRDVVA